MARFIFGDTYFPCFDTTDSDLLPIFEPQTRISYKVKLTKVALLVGINYAGIKGWDLKGPHNDVRNLKELLIVKRNYLRENVIVLTDEEGTPDDMRPNMRNLRRVLETFVPGHPGCKTFFFAYSGHAAQREETGPTFVEDDHLEEFIIPCDAVIAEEEAGGLRVDNELIITDKELKGYLVNSLSKNAHMTALFDTCHSGTLLNLKHTKCNEFHGAWGRFRRVYGRGKS
ncbi:hypothetical protein D9613_009842 [Agrocybe pediades]|uniref:Peptidase C14 caspase domain-containing protein n=1 Tax=Agrocybe pediades TaxID=84607 RepID=A0A8H4QXE6_9AGAR|nr:hypothetical protein D9613_009842 [Agrocybe pediades]